MARENHRKGYTVSYNTESHIAVLFRPKVLPYCLWNVAVDATIQILKDFYGIDLGISDKGHTFINYFMAFLMVSRVNMTLNRFNEARKNLATMYSESRDLVQQVVVLSYDRQNDAAKKWRQEVTYRCMLLLRVVMAAIDYTSHQIPSWDIPQLTEEEKHEIKQRIFLKLGAGPQAQTWARTGRSEREESMRVPALMGYKLRTAIQSNRQCLSPPLEPLQEVALFNCLNRFMTGWTGTRYFLTTPVAFPLVQMTRTFLFAYVFTLPFALLSDVSSPVAHCFVIFLLTYGYIGLETVSLELDDPFGEDDNNFDNL